MAGSSLDEDLQVGRSIITLYTVVSPPCSGSVVPDAWISGLGITCHPTHRGACAARLQVCCVEHRYPAPLCLPRLNLVQQNHHPALPCLLVEWTCRRDWTSSARPERLAYVAFNLQHCCGTSGYPLGGYIGAGPLHSC